MATTLLARSRVLLVLAFVLAGASRCACTDTPDPAPDAGGKPDASVDAGDDAGTPPVDDLGTPCEADEDCDTGLCLDNKRCSRACTTNTDCPLVGGWSCEKRDAEAELKSCLCTPKEAADSCESTDLDCDGDADPGTPCEAGLVCAEGVCACPAERQCGDQCFDMMGDPDHCGACDKKCLAGESCRQGVCSCAGTVCGTTCVDTQADPQHCGACNDPCEQGQVCSAGECLAPDPEWANWPILGFSSLTSAGEVVEDTLTGRTWQRTVDETARTLADAEAYCAALELEGKDDWRVPTRIELLSIVDYGRATPAIDVLAFPETPPTSFWSKSESAADATKAWAINFDDGFTDMRAKGDSMRVRCVR